MADDLPFPVFASDGTMQGNLTSAWGQAPQAESALSFQDNGSAPALSWSNLQLPSLSGISAGSFSGSSSGSASGGVATSPAGTSASAPSNAQAGAQPTPTGGIATGSFQDYFFRAVIIILGFIFVAIGLNMFRPGTIPLPRVGHT